MSYYKLIGRYVGNKSAYIRKIKAFFDKKCTMYIEPYAGGLGIFFCLYNNKYRKEHINDKNSSIIFLYKALASKRYRQCATEAILNTEKDDIRAIAEKAFKESRENIKVMDEEHVKRLDNNVYTNEEVMKTVQDIYRVYTQSFNACGNSYSSRRSQQQYKLETERSLKNAMERICKDNLEITNTDAADIIKANADREEVQFYLDPPYVGMYRRSQNIYTKEMADLLSHIKMAETIKNASAAIVLSGYRSELENVPTIYDAILGDDWHCFKIGEPYNNCRIVRKGEKKNRVAEYIWTNRIPPNADIYCSLKDYREKLTISEYWKKIKMAGEMFGLPSRHMKEYNDTYKSLYEGKELFTDKQIKEVKERENKEKKERSKEAA